jgi:hypothetical protein
MMWKPATRGNSERCFFQVGFGFARMLWTGMVDERKHLYLIPKVVNFNPAIESCCFIFVLSLCQTLTLTLTIQS